MHPLQGIYLFVEVAKTRNFSRAAELLGIPKSTLSRQIAELERAVGVQLLSRTTRKVELTDAGQLYFERCRRIIAAAQVAHEELQNLAETPSGLLRVNMPSDFGTGLLTEVFTDFSDRYSEVCFHLDQANPEHASRVFQSCDIAIEIGERPDSTRIARQLGVLYGYLYASPAYLARHGEPRHPSDLARHQCLTYRAENSRIARWPLSNGDALIEFAPRSRFSINTMTMMHSLTVQGAGIGIMARVSSLQADLAAHRLQRVLPEWHAGPYPVYAVTESRLLPAKTRIFIEFLMQRLDSGAAVPGVFETVEDLARDG
ncbi:LysR family transcriptional regulator [Bordetella sp. FB-8]|uniref:LysR family transcriptional regulator n=1 Tax=Bordetella sp. FB-8 TaxID=1159870 RepID=UPI00035E2E96|nr:LysR family transcriptional regulator [Bordetella sp. FB-8]